MSAENSIDLYRTEPGTLAGRYLRSFWQPVYRAKDLPAGEAVPLRIMSEDFTVYRGRKRQGSRGRVSLRPPRGRSFRQAGWKTIVSDVFITAGNMTRQGSVSSSPARMRRSRSKIKIRSYPTEEYLGLIFAFLGDGAAPPLPRYSDLDAGGIVDVLLSEEWPCNYFNRLDNLGDPVHVPFTHRESRRRIGVDVVVPDQLDCGGKRCRHQAHAKLALREKRSAVHPHAEHEPPAPSAARSKD